MTEVPLILVTATVTTTRMMMAMVRRMIVTIIKGWTVLTASFDNFIVGS